MIQAYIQWGAQNLGSYAVSLTAIGLVAGLAIVFIRRKLLDL